MTQNDSDKEPDARLSWRESPTFLLVTLTLVSTINWADRQVVPILFPGIKADLGLSDTELGIIGGLAFSIIYAVSSFVFGFLGGGPLPYAESTPGAPPKALTQMPESSASAGRPVSRAA